MTDISSTELIQLLSGHKYSVNLFMKDGRKAKKIPVEVEAVPDRIDVYYKQKLYMQFFQYLIQNPRHESIHFDMQIVTFGYQGKKAGLQIRSAEGSVHCK